MPNANSGGHGGGDDDGHHHEMPRHEMPFYAPPRTRYQWGVPRENRHVSSSQLFFDLPFVGVSFRAGSLLGEDLGWENLLIFLSTILLLYGAWFSRLSLDAMLRFDDNLHRFVFVVQTLLVALAAHQLSEEEDLRNFASGQALGFTLSLLAYHVLQLGIWIELWVVEHEEANTKVYARTAALMECVPVCLLISAVVLINFDQPLLAVAVVWLSAYLVGRAAWQIYALAFGLSETNSIPFDAGFCIVRFGRFTMLMMGEGVLQIIIFTGLDRNALVPALSASWFALFFLAYFMMGVLQLLHYTSMPFSENDHVLLRGPRVLAVIWIELFAFYSCALISCGVAVKKILNLHTKMHPDLVNVADVDAVRYEAVKYSGNRRTYYWFLAASLASATFLLAVQQLLQVDLVQELGIRIVSLAAPSKRPVFANPSSPTCAAQQDLEAGGPKDQAQGNNPKKLKRARPTKTSFVRAPGSRTRSMSLTKAMTPKRRLRFGTGHEKKRAWFARLFLVPCAFLPLGSARVDPVFVVLAADALLLGLLVFDIIRGRFKRKRKLNRTMAVVIAIGKLKYRVRKRREERAREALMRDLEARRGDEDCGPHSDHGGGDLEEHGIRESELAPAVPRTAVVRDRSPSDSSGSHESSSALKRIFRTASNASAESLQAMASRLAPRVRAGSAGLWAVEAKRRTLMQQIRLFMRDKAIYRPFVPRLDQTHLHTAHEMKWQNLFYDLVVVALAYRLNHMDFEYLHDFQLSTLALYVLELSAVLDCWNKHNQLQATFISGDVLHRLVNIFQFGLVAFLASAVPVRAHRSMSDARYVTYMYGFATAKLLFELVVVGQIVEIWFTFRDNAPARGSAKHFALVSAINIALLLTSYAAIALEADVLVIVALWGAGHYVSFALELRTALGGKARPGASLPVDLGFLAHRESELGLIMIGEGILSSINATLTQAVKHYVNLALGFAIVASTKFNYFFIQRFSPREMAARKSRVRGAVVTGLLPLFMIALSAVGGITVYSFVEDASFHTSNADELGFRALPLSAVVALLCAFDMMHEGPAETVYWEAAPWTMFAVYVAKAVLVAAFWVIIWVDVTSSATLGLFWADLLLLFLVHAQHVKVRERHALPDDLRSCRTGVSSIRSVVTAQDDIDLRLEDFDEDTCDVVIRERSGRDFALG